MSSAEHDIDPDAQDTQDIYQARIDGSPSTRSVRAGQYEYCASCGARIVWLRHLTTQRAAPIDALPTDKGNIIINAARGTYVVLGKADDRRPYAGWLHTNHFMTCPSAETWHKHGSMHDTSATRPAGRERQP